MLMMRAQLWRREEQASNCNGGEANVPTYRLYPEKLADDLLCKQMPLLGLIERQRKMVVQLPPNDSHFSRSGLVSFWGALSPESKQRSLTMNINCPLKLQRVKSEE
jgi:hypothetical protein